jgi:hypothetical protein
VEDTQTFSEVPLINLELAWRVCLVRHYSKDRYVRQTNNPASKTLVSDPKNVFECMATAHVLRGHGEGEYFAEILVSSQVQPSFDYLRPNLQVPFSLGHSFSIHNTCSTSLRWLVQQPETTPTSSLS